MVTLGAYQEFITNAMQIPTTALSPTAPVIEMTLAVALEVVNPALMAVSGCPSSVLLSLGSNVPVIYDLAVYNLAADYLLNFAQDLPGQTYFSDTRKALVINNFVAGVISESHDETTGESILNPKFMETLTLSDLQRMKTPYGRQYMMFAQQYGVLWGLS